jgi:hypothetical protein
VDIDPIIDHVNRVAEKTFKYQTEGISVADVMRSFAEGKPAPYRPKPADDDVDNLIPSIVEFFRSADSDCRGEIVSKVNGYAKTRFVNYAYSMAVEAVRQKSPRMIEDGLAALAIENGGRDIRDSLPTLPLLYHSAKKLGMDVVTVFEEAARLAVPGRMQKEMKGFPSRSPKDRGLEAFYFVEKSTEAGFDYEHRPPWKNKPQDR